MTTHKNALIDASTSFKVYACYCDRKNYKRIALLCLELGIQFTAYSEEYLTFSEDVSDTLKRHDSTLVFDMAEETWGCCGSFLGYQPTINHVYVKTWNFDTCEYDETIYHRQ